MKHGKEERRRLYEHIKGIVDYIGPEYVVVENNGIGYQLFTPNPYQFSKYEGQEVKVYTYQYVREDLIHLYGFLSREEKLMFLKLLNVSGIGPKGALAILASGEPAQVIQAIEEEDEAFLTKFPGVGKKTARQMILDLKGKLAEVVPDFVPNLFNVEKLDQKKQEQAELEEALLALKALGYSEKEIKKITPTLQQESLSTDEFIKKALQLLLK
jgi:holliday junction DNA helicase RuvA